VFLKTHPKDGRFLWTTFRQLVSMKSKSVEMVDAPDASPAFQRPDLTARQSAKALSGMPAPYRLSGLLANERTARTRSALFRSFLAHGFPLDALSLVLRDSTGSGGRGHYRHVIARTLPYPDIPAPLDCYG
jgi:hypothetical protein